MCCRSCGRALVVVLMFVLGLAAFAPDARAAECRAVTVTAAVEADSWIDQNSVFANKGADAVLDVGGTSRALVRFALPSRVPEGCAVESARLRLFADSGTEGTRVEVIRLAFGWSESLVTWGTQPATVGTPSTAWSGEGYMQWNVTSSVHAMLAGVNHGFLVRDAAEGTELAGGHGFFSKEKGESPPQLVIRFATPSAGEPAPPAQPTPAAVTCGQELTASVRLTNDLTNCPGDGLVIGAPRIVVDLDGHTVDGVGLGTGVRNDGFTRVTVQNGTVQEFDRGVHLLPETTRNAIERLALRGNEVAGVELFDAGDGIEGNQVVANTFESNGVGIAMLSGTTATVVADNALTRNNGAALLVRDSDANRLERNTVSGGGDLGIGLERASRNVLLENTVADNSDGGIQIMEGSHDNRVEGNRVSESGDTGILVSESDGNALVSNVSELMSDSGITLNSANDGVVSGNELGSNPGGLEMDGSSRNLIEANDASHTTGTGIELLGGSFDNDVVRNTASLNSARGIYVSDEAELEPGNRLVGNTASGNGSDGIMVAKGGHRLTANVARNNGGWGINTGPLTVDGGRNVATGNGEDGQCAGVICRAVVAEDMPPDTTLTGIDDSSGRFTFAGSDDWTAPADLRFECRLDDEEWHACTSPAAFGGLGSGPHVFEVRAIDEAGNTDPTSAGHGWTIPETEDEPPDTTPPQTTIDSGPATGTTDGTTDVAAPPDLQGPRLVGRSGLRGFVTATARGALKLRIGRFDEAVRGVLRLRTAGRRGVTLAVKRFTARPGAAVAVTVRLSKATQRLLAGRRRLKVRATVTASDWRGNSVKVYRFMVKAHRR
jgi:large repetitive protein